MAPNRAASSGTSRETLKEHLTELIWGGLSAVFPVSGATTPTLDATTASPKEEPWTTSHQQ